MESPEGLPHFLAPGPRQANSRMTPTDLGKFYAQILKVSPITTGYYWMNTYTIIWKESSLGKELCLGLRVLPGRHLGSSSGDSVHCPDTKGRAQKA